MDNLTPYTPTSKVVKDSPTVQLCLVSEGTPYEVGRPGYRRSVLVGREWEVYLDDTLIGSIRYGLVTRERRTAGRTYLNARWQSPGWRYAYPADPGHKKWFEGFTKAESVRYLLDARAPHPTMM